MSNVPKILSRILLLAIFLAAIFVLCCVLFFDRQESHPRTPMDTCIANLKQIEGAKSIWALEHAKGSNDVPAWDEIIGTTNYINEMPT
jgi:hypothetical protein